MKRSRDDLIIGLLIALLVLQIYALFFHRQVVIVDNSPSTSISLSQAPQLRPPSSAEGTPSYHAPQVPRTRQP